MGWTPLRQRRSADGLAVATKSGMYPRGNFRAGLSFFVHWLKVSCLVMQGFCHIVGLLALVVMATVRGQASPAGGAGATAVAAPSATSPSAVAVEALIAEAIKDIDAFSTRLDGKTVTLEGKVREIRDSHVFLVGRNQKETNRDGIDCSFTEETPSMRAQIKALKVGDTVRITGDFLAATLIATSPTINLYMCSKIEVVAAPAGSQPVVATKPVTMPAATRNH
jgi:hypothetical protein